MPYAHARVVVAETMKRLRQISGLLIALSLVLPERSCAQNGTMEILYPTSSCDTIGGLLVVVSWYLLPLAVTLTDRFRLALLSVGVSATVLGLYFGSYIGAVFSSSLLLGWYVNLAGAVTYLLASVAELWQSSRTAAAVVILGSGGFVLGVSHDVSGMIFGAGAGFLAGAVFGRLAGLNRPAASRVPG